MSGAYASPAAIIAVSVVFPVLGAVALGLRLSARRQTKTSIAVDDLLLVPALLLEWAIAGLLIWGAATKALGVPLPPTNIPGPTAYLLANSPQQVRMSQIQYHVDWIGTIALGLTKASLLLFYRKIFCTVRNVLKTVTDIMLVVVTAWTITFTLGLILRCGDRPETVWGPHIATAKQCPASGMLREGYANSDFVLDVIIWFMPIPKVWSLHMAVRRKVAVIGFFMIGLLVIAASAVRMAINYTVLAAWSKSDEKAEIWITDLMFWTIIEIGTGLIVLCLLVLRPLGGKIGQSNFLREIRSALSLQSLRSRLSGNNSIGTRPEATDGRSFTGARREATTGKSVSDARVSDAADSFEMKPSNPTSV